MPNRPQLDAEHAIGRYRQDERNRQYLVLGYLGDGNGSVAAPARR